MSSFETVRHGDKGPEGQLSDEGREQAQEKALGYYEEIKQMPGGSIIFITPSNVGRAAETGNEIEDSLKVLCHDLPDVEFISVHDTQRLAEVKEDFTKKYVITDIQPTSLIGFDEKTPSYREVTPYLPAWIEYGKKYKKQDYYIILTWAAKPDELEGLRGEIGEKFPDVKPEEIQPADFVQTPEEEAMKYLRLTQRMSQLMTKYFPDHPYKNIQVGHNPADLGTLALMGREINAENLRELWEGKSRQFLESAKFEDVDGKIRVRYRDHESEREADFATILEDLARQSEQRKVEWSQEKVDSNIQA